ncbi:MAG: hypothetical protein D6679_05235 [Candidatus Hydrogenedentota bacterium]|nr:MAG: hypothetical protein D6679_05235 [Candidatus Hydrogenedentota bacterium]
MTHTICLEIPNPGIRILEFRGLIRDDQPGGILSGGRNPHLVEVNDSARKIGILPGTSLSTILALHPSFQTFRLSQRELFEEHARIAEILFSFTPNLFFTVDFLFLFWITLPGTSPQNRKIFLKEIHSVLAKQGFPTRISEASTRFASRLLCLTMPIGAERDFSTAFRSLPEEQSDHFLQQTPLESFRSFPSSFSQSSSSEILLSDETLSSLEALGVRTLQDLLSLPEQGLLERYEPALHRLYRLGRGWEDLPVILYRPADIPTARRHFEPAIEDGRRLMNEILSLLEETLTVLEEQGRAVKTIHILFERDSFFESPSRIRTPSFSPLLLTITPAEPTTDRKRLGNLLHLHFERNFLSSRRKRDSHQAPRHTKETPSPAGNTSRNLSSFSCSQIEILLLPTIPPLDTDSPLLFDETPSRPLLESVSSSPPAFLLDKPSPFESFGARIGNAPPNRPSGISPRILESLSASFGADVVGFLRVNDLFPPEDRFTFVTEPDFRLSLKAFREPSARPPSTIRRFLLEPLPFPEAEVFFEEKKNLVRANGRWWDAPFSFEALLFERGDTGSKDSRGTSLPFGLWILRKAGEGIRMIGWRE